MEYYTKYDTVIILGIHGKKTIKIKKDVKFKIL